MLNAAVKGKSSGLVKCLVCFFAQRTVSYVGMAAVISQLSKK